jgi:putative peptide zinc metalloprotease protein
MDIPLQSQQWYRMAGLRPRWRLHVRADRQAVRGEVWHVLSNAAGGRSGRLNAVAWAIVGRCDGRATMQAIWEATLAADAERAPTQDESIALIAQLVQEGFLECDGAMPDVANLADHAGRRRRRESVERFNPLAARVPLGSPMSLLARSGRLAPWLFGMPGLAGWLLLVLAAAGVAAGHWDALVAQGARWMDTPRYWLLSLPAFVAIKAIHEAAHALAVHRFGGRVDEWGIGLLVLIPAPYVDASDANRFASPRERALVSAAGILAELALASAGLIAWWAAEPGWLKDAGFTVALVAGASTLLFNANPLVRMDGYFLLADLLSLPNLATRSAERWRGIARRALLGVDAGAPPAAAPGERGWLLAYAPAAWSWRLALMAWLTVWAGSSSRVLGIAVGALTVAVLVVVPLGRVLHSPLDAGLGLRERAAAWARGGAILAAAAALLLLVPLPDRSVATGVVWLPDAGQVRARTDGFVVAVGAGAATGAPVRQGEVLARLADPALSMEREGLRLRLPGLEARLFATLQTDPSSSRQMQQEIARIGAQLARLEERLAEHEIAAPHAGRFRVDRPEDLPGRFVKEGEPLGWLVVPRRTVIRVALTQDEAARLRDAMPKIAVRLAEAPGEVHPASLRRETPVSSTRLPSAALGDRHGGPVPVDPADREGLRPAQPVFLVDVELDAVDAAQLGGRAWVRFEHPPATLASQWARSMRQTFRARFAPDAV